MKESSDFSGENFHRLCDNKGPTLVLVKSNDTEQIFGGYTKECWASPSEGEFIYDEDAFIFSLT